MSLKKAINFIKNYEYLEAEIMEVLSRTKVNYSIICNGPLVKRARNEILSIIVWIDEALRILRAIRKFAEKCEEEIIYYGESRIYQSLLEI